MAAFLASAGTLVLLVIALVSTAITLFCTKLVLHPPQSDGPGMLIVMLAIPVFGLIAAASWMGTISLGLVAGIKNKKG